MQDDDSNPITRALVFHGYAKVRVRLCVAVHRSISVQAYPSINHYPRPISTIARAIASNQSSADRGEGGWWGQDEVGTILAARQMCDGWWDNMRAAGEICSLM